jgi:hypothetical protein
VVSWENHEFQSSQDNALVLKNFIFMCTNSYLYIFYQIFFLPELPAERLRNNIIITFIFNFLSKSILVIAAHQNYLWPYVVYRWRKRTLEHRWLEFKTLFYDPLFKNKKINDQAAEGKE